MNWSFYLFKINVGRTCSDKHFEQALLASCSQLLIFFWSNLLNHNCIYGRETGEFMNVSSKFGMI